MNKTILALEESVRLHLDEGDVYPVPKPGGIGEQLPGAHEMGHSMGLQHPGAGIDLPPGQDQYHYDGLDANGNYVNGPSDLMGAGNNLQPFYYQNLADAVNSTTTSVGCINASCSPCNHKV